MAILSDHEAKSKLPNQEPKDLPAKTALSELHFHKLMNVHFGGFALYTLIHYLAERPRATVICLIGTLLTGLVRFLATKAPEHLRPLGHLNLAVVTATLSAHAWNGALLNDSPWFLTLIPLFAAYLFGWKETAAWAGIVTAVYSLMLLAVSQFGPEPEWVVTNMENHRNQILLLWLISFMGIASARSLRAESLRSQSQAEFIESINQQLTEANQSLAQKNNDIKLFASAASHDLQAPIRRSQSFVEIIRKDMMPENTDKVAVWLDHLEQQLDGARSLVTDLLNYAELESKLSKPEQVDTSELFVKIKMSTSLVGDLDLQPDLPVVHSHQTLLYLFFTNLVENGFRYNQSANPQVQVRIEEDTDSWLFSIIDNGIGIEEASLKRVFEPFRRLHRPEDYPGSGLGLAICKRIAELLGAELSAQSKLEEGSTFTLRLPKSPTAPLV